MNKKCLSRNLHMYKIHSGRNLHKKYKWDAICSDPYFRKLSCRIQNLFIDNICYIEKQFSPGKGQK